MKGNIKEELKEIALSLMFKIDDQSFRRHNGALDWFKHLELND
nr:hypothetical protein [Mycoplasmopsis bovis]